MNISNYIWGYNAVIGTNSYVEKYSDEEKRKYLKSNLTLYESKRAMYNVRFNNEPLEVDVENTVSQILQYLYYLSFKTSEDLYSDVPRISKQFTETYSTSVIAVCKYIYINHFQSFPIISNHFKMIF